MYVSRIILFREADASESDAETFLAGDGHEVTLVSDLSSCLASMQKGDPGLVVLELSESSPDPADLIKALKQQKASVMVLIGLEYHQRARLQVVFSQGADECAFRPYDPSELRARVRNLLKLRRLAHELREAWQELEKTSSLDTLTGALNRRGFDLRLDEEFERARRYLFPLALLVLDIDGFRQLNKNEGRPAGDAVLKAVAERLKRSLRRSDVLGRCGGDEFLVMLPHTSYEKAKLAGERLSEAVAGLVLKGRTGRLRIGLSFGISCYYAKNFDESYRLVEVAKESLFVNRAKKGGERS